MKATSDSAAAAECGRRRRHGPLLRARFQWFRPLERRVGFANEGPLVSRRVVNAAREELKEEVLHWIRVRSCRVAFSSPEIDAGTRDSFFVFALLCFHLLRWQVQHG